MRLTRLEFLAMNNPVRRFLQKHIEFRTFTGFLKKHGVDMTGKAILDAGCGSGYGTELIIREFSPVRVEAFDFMPEQIDLAEKRGLNAHFFVGDVAHIGLPPETLDAVFVFGVLHHVPEWREGLREIARVLRPSGVLLVEEILGPMAGLFTSLGFVHPKGAWFDLAGFVKGMESAGLKILERKKLLLEGFQSFLCRKQPG